MGEASSRLASLQRHSFQIRNRKIEAWTDHPGDVFLAYVTHPLVKSSRNRTGQFLLSWVMTGVRAPGRDRKEGVSTEIAMHARLIECLDSFSNKPLMCPLCTTHTHTKWHTYAWLLWLGYDVTIAVRHCSTWKKPGNAWSSGFHGIPTSQDTSDATPTHIKIICQQQYQTVMDSQQFTAHQQLRRE